MHHAGRHHLGAKAMRQHMQYNGRELESTHGQAAQRAKTRGERMRSVKLALLLLAAALVTRTAWADCLDDAANYWGVPPILARAVAQQESQMRANAIGRNTNGSRDIGLMQINSSWLPTLRRYGITEADLFDGCKNAYIGNWIIAQNIAHHGYNWTAIGAYNAVSPEKRDAYARKIYKQLMRLQGSVAPSAPSPLAAE
ncbi:lytic transglycosylase domain-containing protein [Ralstonia sp. OTU4908]|uniref:lytic transglycosylase domain-containing protein n=1 Tax=Ralstonia sp. OTU4908 TaxID=3043851 RepID=UPI00313F0269